MLTPGDWPTFVITSNAGLTRPGTYVFAGSSTPTFTMPARDPITAGVPRRMALDIFKVVVLGHAAPLTLSAGSDQFHVGGATVSTMTLNPGESVELINDGGYWVPLGGWLPTATFRRIGTTAATTLTLNRTASLWTFTGSSATTWTLPALSLNTGLDYLIKNKGSADITLQRAGSDNLYTTTAVTSITITAGNSARVVNDGTHWVVI